MTEAANLAEPGPQPTRAEARCALIGDATQMRHDDEMTASIAAMDHGDGHGEVGELPGRDHGRAGMTGEMTHTLSEPGTILIRCHEPGHWEGA